MIKLRRDAEKICDTCKKSCEDDYVFMSAPTGSRIVCLCPEHANELVKTCQKFNISCSIY